MSLSHTSWRGQKNRGSCRRREIHNLGGFGTILPELRKEHKACVGKLWHISKWRCLEDHSSFLWIYPRNLKIGFLFSAMCMFYFYLSALCLGTFFYYILPPSLILLRFAVYLFWSTKLGWKCYSTIYIYETAASMRGLVVCTRISNEQFGEEEETSVYSLTWGNYWSLTCVLSNL